MDYIVRNFAFRPPDRATYRLRKLDVNAEIFQVSALERASFSNTEEERIQAFKITTSTNNKIVCLFLPHKEGAENRLTLFFSHGNAVDLGQMLSFFFELSEHFGVNIFSYDYSGYGESMGEPSEENLYADAECAFDKLTSIVEAQSILLYGQSLGSVPTIHLASKKDTPKVAGVILHSPLASAVRMVSTLLCKWKKGPFRNVDKVANIQAPTLVIHGTEDKVISADHGREIYKNLSETVAENPVWVEGAGHNDINSHPIYWTEMKKFIDNRKPIDLGIEATE